MTIVLLEALTFGLARLRDAAARAGHPLCLLTAHRPAYGYELDRLSPPDVRVVDVDTSDVRACAAVLDRIPDLAGLVNSTDTWMLPGAELAERYGLPTLGLATARTLRDKARVRTLLRRAGLSRADASRLTPTPEAVVSAARSIGYPLIVKDAAGTSSRSVWLIRDDTERDEAARQVADATLLGGHLVAEPYFPGPVYSAETVTWQGRTRLLGVAVHVHTPEPVRREEAVAFPVALPDDDLDRLERWIGEVLATVGLSSGVAHTEYAHTPDGPEVVEVNGRIAGAVIGEMMCRALRVDVYDAVVATALGRRPRLLDAPLRPARGYGMAFLHPPAPGRLAGWRGPERLPLFPGAPEFYPTARVGDPIVHLADQRGCTALVLAEGPTAELGLYHALAAAGTVSHDMRPLDRPRQEPAR
ncbi:ATP-grasp domain-containing protein [Micromonospora sp. WMMD882]|uniref:ATP-grasp domain-containing protein n=1 Tax=Micromonospora sp. WMMD882 TaxID=3015151 RepID=UPI00248B354E|nr:ATP-grasp domain-containing protein [Micromonospora sp. WMMD882]WBB81234.1 ATP-grasp domain-containing protein [Micromonospora sp. WMMD882]